MSRSVHVSRTPKDTGPAAWNSIIHQSEPFPELDNRISADWVVVGAGYAGIAAARRLSQLVNGDRIVLLEACGLAEGPAGRNSGFMIDLPHDLNSKTYAGARDEDLKQIRLNRAAIDFAADMASDWQMPPEVFRRTGKVTGAASPRGEKHISSYLQHLRALDEDFQLMDAVEMKALTGTDYYRRGLFTPGAAMIQPAAFVHRVARGLSRTVSIYERSPVIEMQLGRDHLLKTPRGSVSARNVILAVNGHIQSFGYFPKKLLHAFTYASMTRPLTAEEVRRLGGESDWGVLPADPMGTTVRRSSDFMGSGDRITVRNRFTLNQSLEVTDKHIRNVASTHDQAFRARFPMLSEVPMEHRWGGRLCLSLNSVPAFGELEERVFSAACQNGLGTVKGTMSGMMAADLATGNDSPMLQDYRAYDQPGRLPPEPFLSIGANATMRWKEWLAGVEL